VVRGQADTREKLIAKKELDEFKIPKEEISPKGDRAA
jgi:hypothetical protein